MWRGWISVIQAAMLAVGLAACTTADYSSGVTAFSQAVTQADTTEQALATADQQAKLDQWLYHVERVHDKPDLPDFAKCRALGGGYRAGDCTVTFDGAPPPLTADKSAMASLVKYAALLSSVVADKTCTSLTSDAKDLGTAVKDIAKDAGGSSLSAAAAPIATLAATGGCYFIAADQLRILRTATSAASDPVNQLVTLIAANSRLMQDDVLENTISELQDASLRYSESRSSAGLKLVVSLSQAVDGLQTSPAADVIIKKLGTLHQTLASDLASPKVDLKNVENDAQAFGTSMATVAASLDTLEIARTAKVGS